VTYERLGITGANGFIGAHLLRSAIARGHRPIAFLQPDSPMAAIADLEGQYEPFPGDLLDSESLERFVSSCDTIIHLAGYNRYWAVDPTIFRRINVDAVRQLAEFCLKYSIQKLVHVSSCVTLGASADATPRNEDASYNLTSVPFSYGETKNAGEEEIKRYQRERGLPVVIINPTSAVGEMDHGPTPIGKPIADIARGMWPVYVAGGACFIDVRDVVRGLWLALERAQPGSQYLLAGENLSNREFMSKVSWAAGVSPPSYKIPRPLLGVAAGVMEWHADRITRREPVLTRGMAGLIGKFLYFDGSRAERELGFKAGPSGPAIQRCVDWFKEPQWIRENQILSLVPAVSSVVTSPAD
jgi:dihydroflavonol-4-reductase